MDKSVLEILEKIVQGQYAQQQKRRYLIVSYLSLVLLLGLLAVSLGMCPNRLQWVLVACAGVIGLAYCYLRGLGVLKPTIICVVVLSLLAEYAPNNLSMWLSGGYVAFLFLVWGAYMADFDETIAESRLSEQETLILQEDLKKIIEQITSGSEEGDDDC